MSILGVLLRLNQDSIKYSKTVDRASNNAIIIIINIQSNSRRRLDLTRKRPKFRFGKNFAELFVIQFHAHLQYTGIKRTDYAILCNKSFSQSQQNSTIHISTTPFYVVKLSACCGEGFYIHALILQCQQNHTCDVYVSLKHDTLYF